ncbi:MAG: hypothetical protein Tsb0013_13830 [Phycisphaerales bacterium]
MTNQHPKAPRPFLGIHFRCCRVYGRLYKTPAGDRYVGRCPKCGVQVDARVGEGGTSRRFFTTT